MAAHTETQPALIPNDENWRKPDTLAPVTPLSLMQLALERGQVEQLQILQEMHFKQMAKDAEIEFNMAMNAVQAKLHRIAPDLNNKQTSSKYASYAKLDSVLRPIYTEHGFSLSFDTAPDIAPEIELVRVRCYVSHVAGHTRTYHKDVPCDGKGAKGGDVMTKTHARGAADSYGMRYLLKMIFNIAIGEEDTDGNMPAERQPEHKKEYEERCKHFDKCLNAEELKEHWMASRKWAREIKDESAVNDFDYLKEKRKKELARAGEA